MIILIPKLRHEVADRAMVVGGEVGRLSWIGSARNSKWGLPQVIRYTTFFTVFRFGVIYYLMVILKILLAHPHTQRIKCTSSKKQARETLL